MFIMIKLMLLVINTDLVINMYRCTRIKLLGACNDTVSELL